MREAAFAAQRAGHGIGGETTEAETGRLVEVLVDRGHPVACGRSWRQGWDRRSSGQFVTVSS